MSKTQATIQMDADKLALLDAMIPLLRHHPSLSLARSSRGLVVRAAVERGLPLLAAELGVSLQELEQQLQAQQASSTEQPLP